MNEYHISLEYPFNRNDSIATIGGLTLHCASLQNKNEVVISVNPNFTEFNEELVECIATGSMLVFNIHKPEPLFTKIGDKIYHIELKTWSKTADEKGLRFDFLVNEKSA